MSEWKIQKKSKKGKRRSEERGTGSGIGEGMAQLSLGQSTTPTTRAQSSGATATSTVTRPTPQLTTVTGTPAAASTQRQTWQRRQQQPSVSLPASPTYSGSTTKAWSTASGSISQPPSRPTSPPTPRQIVSEPPSPQSCWSRIAAKAASKPQQVVQMLPKKTPVNANKGQLPGDIDQIDIRCLTQKSGNVWNPTYFLSRGAFGAVFEVSVGQNRLNLPVGKSCVAKINKAPKSDQQYSLLRAAMLRELTINEFLIMKVQPHPNVLICHELFTESLRNEERAYMMMDFTQLGTSDDVMKWAIPMTGGFSEPETKWLTFGLAMAIDYLKNVCNIAHCDIKPGNVLVFYNPDPAADRNDVHRFWPKLCDFSNSEIRDPDRNRQGECAVSGFRCTLGFGPPEAFPLPQRPYDGYTVDVYTLGTTAYAWRFRHRLFQVSALGGQYGEASLNFVRAQQTDQEVRNSLRDQFKDVAESQMEDLLVEVLREKPRDRLTIEQVTQHPWFK